jgi:hypothetical protein
VCGGQHKIGRDGDAAAKMVRANDQNHVTGNCLVSKGCTADDGASGFDCEREAGEGEERVRWPSEP